MNNENEQMENVEGEIKSILKPLNAAPNWQRPVVSTRESVTPQEQQLAESVSITEYLYNLDVKLTAVFSKLDEMEEQIKTKIDIVHRVLR